MVVVKVVSHPTDHQGYGTSWRAVELASAELQVPQSYDEYKLLGWD
jgi:hypothetical protein